MLFITSYIIPFLLNFLATSIVYVGILFISGQLMPSLLNEIYNNSSIVLRAIVAIVLCSGTANIIMSYVYSHWNASTAGITAIISLVLILTIIAILIDNIKINATIIVSLILAILACSFLLFNLTQNQ